MTVEGRKKEEERRRTREVRRNLRCPFSSSCFFLFHVYAISTGVEG
jgi:hypothetical protein